VEVALIRPSRLHAEGGRETQENGLKKFFSDHECDMNVFIALFWTILKPEETRAEESRLSQHCAELACRGSTR